MINERTTLILASSRDEIRLMRAVITVNENLYEHEVFANERIVMNTIRNENGDILKYEIEGSPLDFFHIGLRYGKDEEKDRIKDMPKAVREIMLENY